MSSKISNKFTFIDLYAGIGGMRIPFEELGGKCVFSSENDKFARKTYSEMFNEKDESIGGDIEKISAIEIPKHNILLAGFPCQPFSNAGLKKGFNDTRGTAFGEIERIIKFHSPDAILLENVSGLKNHDQGKTLKTILNTLEDKLGYYVPEPEILNAKDFGLPQNRKRIYIVAFRKKNLFQFPKVKLIKTYVSDILDNEENIDKKYTISTKLWKSHQKRKKINCKAGKGFGYKLTHPDDQFTRTLSNRYYKDGSEILIFRGKYKNPRMLTPKECSKLQGFPKKWENLSVSKNQAYRQFGNAVPVKVVREIANNIIKSLKL